MARISLPFQLVPVLLVAEIEAIRQALQIPAGNRTHAARLLRVSHRALLYKLKEYGLQP